MKIKDVKDSEFFIKEKNHILTNVEIYRVPSIYSVFLLEDAWCPMIDYHGSDKEKQIIEICISTIDDTVALVFLGPDKIMEFISSADDIQIAVYNASVTWNGVY